ncbi:hypothetical protein Cgig2_025449 [Carnegiea gigantea]|uniref:Uncharacterized protein n=1 Tax=Carnegiea gigantea TaxID=171969 RepID=A0A9Q1GUL4_9CARY|nr:hypothetical protein Cgig2_025449 [Carnegiea gigantea]
MLLNEAERLRVLGGRALRSLEVALVELRWSSFESWRRIFAARFRPGAGLGECSGAARQEEGLEVEPADEGSTTESMAFPPIYNTREMADYVRESFVWRWRSASRPPRPLLEDFLALCPSFSLSEAEGAAAEFEFLEIVQAIFYAMLLNEVVELGVAHEFSTEGLKSALVGVRWSAFKVWMDCVDHALRTAQLQRPTDEVEVRGPLDGQEEGSEPNSPPAPSSDEEWPQFCFEFSFDPLDPGLQPLTTDYHDRCRRFDLEVARRYVHDSNLLEMVLAILYAMVIHDATELGLSHKLTMDIVMWAMQKLDWGAVAHPRDSPANLVLVGSPSRERTFSFPSFRDTVQAAEYVQDNLR